MKEDFKSAIKKGTIYLILNMHHRYRSIITYRSTELHTDTSVPSIAEMYSRIPQSEHVETMASVNLFPTSSINDSTM